jgi:glutamate/tyrosine decarboxylase-like PLP-dependent enzyme
MDRSGPRRYPGPVMRQQAPADTKAALEVAVGHAFEFIESLEHRAVNATVDAVTLRERLDLPLAADGIPARDAIDRLVRGVEGGLLGMPSGRFFAWVIGGALPAALGADWLTSAWGQNAALYGCSPAAAVVEEVAGKWLKELLGLPPDSSFALVTGCQMAHVTALAAARHALLRAHGWDVEAKGLWGAPPMRIISSRHQHASVERAVRILGMGTECVTPLDPNDRDVIDPSDLREALATDANVPVILLLQAGDINTGVFDAFESLIPIAKRYGAWVHVDGAFGLWAGASPRHRHLVAGVQGADSWATDGHKWLNVPFDCGYAFVRDSAAHRAAMSVSAPYIAAGKDARDPIDWNPEWSRRARGFATFAALLELGRNGVADLIERSCRYASKIVEGLGRLPGAEVLSSPILNQGLVRFLDPREEASEVDHDRQTERVVRAVATSGEAFFAATTWRGKRAMRVSVLNWRTSDGDARRAVAAVQRVLAEIADAT